MENEVTTRNKKTNYMPWILGTLGIGALLYFFMSNKSTTTTPTSPSGIDRTPYKLSYWMWKILKSTSMADSISSKAQASGTDPNIQLKSDANLKMSETLGSDFEAFCTAIDTKLASMGVGSTLQNALDWMVNEAWRVYALQKIKNTNANTSAENNINLFS